MRRAARRDLSEPAIVDALEAVGAFCYRLSVPVDLLVYFRERWWLLEVKTKRDTKEGGRHKGSREQRAFCLAFAVPIVETAEEALQAIGALPATQPRVEGDSPVAHAGLPYPIDFHVTPVYR